MEPESREETLKRVRGLRGVCFVSMFKLHVTFLKGMAIHGIVFPGFVLALIIIADQVPSFKTGGAFWFTDLTTPDYTFVLPSLTILSYLASHRSFWRETLARSNHFAPREMNCEFYWKCFFSAKATVCVLFLPCISTIFPKAVYCYMLTSNVFSLCINSYLNNPDVRKALGFPELPVPTPSFFSTNIGRKNWPSFYKR